MDAQGTGNVSLKYKIEPIIQIVILKIVFEDLYLVTNVSDTIHIIILYNTMILVLFIF